MKLTIEQTDKILKKLEDYNFQIIDLEESGIGKIEEISEEYFNEKVNEALEEDWKMYALEKILKKEVLNKQDTEDFIQHNIEALDDGRFVDFKLAITNVLYIVGLYEERNEDINKGNDYRGQLSDICDKYISELRWKSGSIMIML